MPRRHCAVLAFLVSLGASAACYKPNIQDGGLNCGDGGTCPEGFHCAANGTCKQGPPPKCSASSPHLAPLCAPTLGAECDPGCNGGCDCGRCALVGTVLKCVAPGTKQRGELCSPGTDPDECEPGHYCMSDCDPKVGRCVRFCGKGDARNPDLCSPGQMCNVPVTDANGGATDLWACPQPPKPCNPVGETVDCDDPGLGCYFDDTVMSTVCDCRGKNMPDGNCSVFNSCVAGYRCITMGNASTCLQTCRKGETDCLTGSCQSIGGGSFGFCAP